MIVQTEGKYDFSNIKADRLADILDKWVVERTEKSENGRCLYIRTAHDLMELLSPGELISTLGFSINRVLIRDYDGMVIEYSDGSENIHGMFERKDLLELKEKVDAYLINDAKSQLVDAIDEIKKMGNLI